MNIKIISRVSARINRISIGKKQDGMHKNLTKCKFASEVQNFGDFFQKPSSILFSSYFFLKKIY